MKLTSHTASRTLGNRSPHVRWRALVWSLHDNSRIRPKLPVELSRADIDGIDACGAALQQTIGESAGRRADIEADLASDIDAQNASSARIKLEAAAADKRQLFQQSQRLHREARSGPASRAFLAVHQNVTGQDQRLRLSAGIRPRPRSTSS